MSYSYNDAGLRTNMTVTGENAVFYRYDNGNRLTNTAQRTFTTSLFYDDSGQNQLTSTTGAALTKGYRFTAREDDSTGLYYYRNRYFQSALGRFVGEDPKDFVAGINLYAYGLANPISKKDPLGLDTNTIISDCADILQEYSNDFPFDTIQIHKINNHCESDDPNGCRAGFLSCMAETLLAPGLTTIPSAGGEALGCYFSAKAFTHAASRSLTTPLRSSIVRGYMKAGNEAGPYGMLTAVIASEGICLMEEWDCLGR